MTSLGSVYVPKITHHGQIISAPLGVVGDRIKIDAVVLCQSSRPIDTPAGRAYSHSHILKDVHGNLIEYRGSTFFPKGNRVQFTATIKLVRKGTMGSIITVVKAPKSV